MLCKGSRNSVNKYFTILDELYEIICKYSQTHEIYIGGDMNARMFTDTADAHDKLFRKFCAEMDITVPKDSPRQPTFINSNGVACSQIDCILSTKASVDCIKKISIDNANALNTSDHLPVSASTTIVLKDSSIPTRIGEPKNAQIYSKVNWKKIDITQYQTHLDDIYMPYQDHIVREVRLLHKISGRLHRLLYLQRRGDLEERKHAGIRVFKEQQSRVRRRIYNGRKPADQIMTITSM